MTAPSTPLDDRIGYDAVGNRTAYQVGASQVMNSTHNSRNQLQSQDVGGPLRVRGTLDEPGTVTVNGSPARMLAGNVFETEIDAAAGLNSFTVQATDASGNVSSNTYEVTVTGDTASYSYDANGNLTQKIEASDTWGYEWNAENQLVRVTKNSVEVATFQYDPLGRRVEKVAGSVTTSWVYRWEDILRETQNDGITTSIAHYVHGSGIDEPLAKEEVGITYYHADALGSIVKMTDQAGSVVHTYKYDAWGNIEVGSAMSGHSYTAREWDAETGLYYYRARYYDPRAGRFESEDPIGPRSGDLNFYAYVGNNPVIAIDPTGLYCTYSQTTGRMICYPASRPAPPQYEPLEPYYDETGYAGKGTGRNNPDMQDVPFVGPLPRGPWVTGSPYDSPNTGRNTIPLTPTRTNTCPSTPRQCNTFRMHGNNRTNDASEGCIILPPNRTQIPPGEVVFVVR